MPTDDLDADELGWAARLENLPEVAFLKTCPTPHALLDGRRVLFMNPAAVSLLDGPNAEYFLGRDLMEWIHPWTRSASCTG